MGNDTEVKGDANHLFVTYDKFAEDLSVGNTVLIDDGVLELKVDSIEGNDVICTVITGGKIGQRKGVNLPGIKVGLPGITDRDIDDIRFGLENGFDYIAASFVRDAATIERIRGLIADAGARTKIIAKIESGEGIENLEEIIDAADGVMVARGDLGVEIPYTEVPAVQKYLIRKCRLIGKRVITATEMLESMIHNPRPTRAEISDVANAVYDGSSAIMLSGETAAGLYPVAAVKTMDEVARATESQIDYARAFALEQVQIKDTQDAISHATCAMAIDVGAKCIAVNSLTGKTARLVSRHRAPVDIIGITTSDRALRQLNMSWGVIPVKSEQYSSVDVMFYRAVEVARQTLGLKRGDRIVLTGGLITGRTGNTNTIRVETV
jgi:pyruvate kinase